MTWTSLFLSNQPLQHKGSPPSSGSFKFDSHSTVVDKIQGYSDSRAPLGKAGNRTKPLSSSSCSPKVHTFSNSLSEMSHSSLRAGNVHSFIHKQGTLPAASQPADFDCIKLFQSRFSS